MREDNRLVDGPTPIFLIIYFIIGVAVVGFVVSLIFVRAPSPPAKTFPDNPVDADYFLPGAIRVLEFTPKSDPTRQCIYAREGGLWCWARDVKAP